MFVHVARPHTQKGWEIGHEAHGMETEFALLRGVAPGSDGTARDEGTEQWLVFDMRN